MDKRREFETWAKDLYEEVLHNQQQLASMKEKYQQELADLDHQLAIARDDLDQARRRCVDLDTAGLQAHEAHAAKDEENKALHKQLSAYSGEVERLREEKEKADETMRKVMAELRELQAEAAENRGRGDEGPGHANKPVVHQPVLPGEVQKVHAQREKGEGDAPPHPEQVRREEAEKQLKAYKQLMDERLQAEKSRGDDLHGKHSATQAEAEAERARWSSLVNELLGILHELQEKFVEQTRYTQQLVGKVRSEQNENQLILSDAESVMDAHTQCLGTIYQCLRGARGSHVDHTAVADHWRSEAENFENKLHNVSNDHRNTAAQLREHMDERKTAEAREKERSQREVETQKRRRRMLREHHDIIFDPNMTPFLKVVLEGVQVTKIQSLENRRPGQTGTQKSQTKRIRLVFDDAAGLQPVPRLKWKLPSDKGPERSQVDLKSIMSFCYGMDSRAPELLKTCDIPPTPERCLSMFSVQRSFDFVFTNEYECMAFVIVLSRLCSHIRGRAVPGSLLTKHKFLAAKGWCKVHQSTEKSGKTLPMALKDACEKAGDAYKRKQAKSDEEKKWKVGSVGFS